MQTGLVFNIQRYSLQDGPGIRTTVFLKGCPAACPWCHNPESRAPEPEILLDEKRCTGCGECLEACPQRNGRSGAKRAGDGLDEDGTSRCLRCGACVEACPSGARSLMGTEMSVDEVLREVLADRIFYEQSRGGVTFSGGEPLAQFAFLKAVLGACKERELHTAVDTCGYAPAERLLELSPLTDLFLYDLKIMDERRHIEWIGVSNSIILENLRLLARKHHGIRIRIPIIPGVNDDMENLEGLAAFLGDLKRLDRVDLLPYHATGMHKFERLGKTYQLGRIMPPSRERMEALAQIFREHGLETSIGG